MKLNDLFPSNYLKKEDVPFPTQAVIRQVTQDEINGDHGKELKAVLHFTANLKPLILNKGNAVTISETYGDDTTAWQGKTIELYNDPSVMFAGKRVGGIRVRVPSPGQRNGQSQQPAQPVTTGYWDVVAGDRKHLNISTQDVQDILADSPIPMTSIWVKPAGAPREQSKTADKWNFTTPIPGDAMDDPIPF